MGFFFVSDLSALALSLANTSLEIWGEHIRVRNTTSIYAYEMALEYRIRIELTRHSAHSETEQLSP